KAPAAGADPTKLPACTGTKGPKGRCVPSNALGGFSGKFEQAGCKSGEECVPEEVVKDGQKIELKKCTAVLNSEGRGFWALAKDMIQNYDVLKGATKDCPPDLICAPCVNPLTKEETGVCRTGSAGGGGAACQESEEDAAKTKSATTKGGGTCPQIEPIIDTK